MPPAEAEEPFGVLSRVVSCARLSLTLSASSFTDASWSTSSRSAAPPVNFIASSTTACAYSDPPFAVHATKTAPDLASRLLSTGLVRPPGSSGGPAADALLASAEVPARASVSRPRNM